MITLRRLAAGLLCEERGSMALETAIVAPVLLALAVGGFDASQLVARQTELQSAAAEAAAIVRAIAPETTAQRNTIRNIVATSTGLPNANVTVDEIYRCGTATDYVTTDTCGSGPRSTYIRVTIIDRRAPIWSTFGIGGPVAYNVARTVQIG
jgi:Flp pilus assembly protein TadG